MVAFKSTRKAVVVNVNRQRGAIQADGSKCPFDNAILFDVKHSLYSREQRLSIKAELQIRKKVMLDADFPSQEIIDEFFQSPIEMTHLKLDWNQPNVIKFLV